MGKQISAYCRIVPPRIAYDETSIGRVLTNPALRKQGLGRNLISHAIVECKNAFPNASIKIGAQVYLQKFYESFGFVISGEAYVEDAIDHIHMILTMD